MKYIITIILLFTLICPSYSQWRGSTTEERAFSKKVMEEFEKIIYETANKMKMNWSFEFDERKKNALEGPTDVDYNDKHNIPYEVQCNFLLYFSPEELERQNFDARMDEYYRQVESFEKSGQKTKIDELTNPEHETTININVIANHIPLSMFQSEGKFYDKSQIGPNEQYLSIPGTQVSLIRTYPGSQRAAQTILQFGEIYFKPYKGKTSYGPGSKSKHTDVKHVRIFIDTSPRLAKEFYERLEVNKINKLIEEL